MALTRLRLATTKKNVQREKNWRKFESVGDGNLWKSLEFLDPKNCCFASLDVHNLRCKWDDFWVLAGRNATKNSKVRNCWESPKTPSAVHPLGGGLNTWPFFITKDVFPSSALGCG